MTADKYSSRTSSQTGGIINIGRLVGGYLAYKTNEFVTVDETGCKFYGDVVTHRLLKTKYSVNVNFVMEKEIVPANVYVESLKRKYRGFDFPGYKLREWFSRVHQVFFDCREPDKSVCLEKLLKRTSLEAFTIFFVVKEPSGVCRFMDASFRNLGTESLEHFVSRYHQQLESMTRLSIQTIGLEYVECIGHGYQELTK